MAAGVRVRGSDVALVFVGPDGHEDSLQKVKDCEITFDAEIITEDYLDSEAPEFDSISNGMKIKASLDINDEDVFDFVDRVERKRRRLADAEGKFVVSTAYTFPSTGRRVRLFCLDVEFGAFPLKSGGRKQYTGITIDGASSRYRIVK